jgi:hypothetical protein
MRVEDGCFRAKEDRNGVRYYLHRLAEGPRREAESPQRPGSAAECADADTLHSVYSALLAALTLTTTHREALRRRGLLDEEIDRRGYGSLPIRGRHRVARDLHERWGDTIMRVPGIISRQGAHGPFVTIAGATGLLVPVRDAIGRIVAVLSRRDEAGDGPRYSYLSSARHGGPGAGAPVHVPAGLTRPCPCVRITEGALKADVTQALSGLATVGLPGAGTWRPVLPILRELGTRTVRLALDTDAADKAPVARALAALAEMLATEGLAVELERWPASHKGIDDALAADAAVEVLTGDDARRAIVEIAAEGTAGDTPAPGPLDRLPEVVANGGAEAIYRDAGLLRALARIAELEPAEYACHRAELQRAGVKLRDLDRALAPLRQEIRRAQPPPDAASCYHITGGRIVRDDGAGVVPLATWAGRIVEEIAHDDGAERSVTLAIEGTLQDGTPLPRVEVPADEWAYMRWPVERWGTRAVVLAGASTADHLRCALQLLSIDVTRRTVYCHTGWRKVQDAWVFLHAGGALGAAGPVADVVVSLPEPLSGFLLPAPPQGDELALAVRASLRILDLGPDPITFPQLAAAYRAVLGGADFSLHTIGPTGTFKSEMGALIEQHFGPAMDSRHLPGNWSSTGNSLEGLAFAAKDVVLVVDDFCPTGSAADIQRYHREADRLFRGQGNHAGRLRMRPDTTFRPARPPRGLILSTGEDVPRGQSLRARLFTVEYSPGDIDTAKLTACQQDAAAGKYAAGLAGFIRWLAPQYEAMQGRLRQEQATLRDQIATGGQHARTPGIVADLALGLRYLLNFAEAVGAISADEAAKVWRRGLDALAQGAEAQVAQIQAAEPAGQFLRLLSAALASGRAHVVDADGGRPPEAPEAWGWRQEEFAAGNGPEIRWRPQGRSVGWLVDQDLFLEPHAAHAEAQRLAVEMGESVPVGASTVRKRLDEKGFLRSTDPKRQKRPVRKTLQGARRDVLHLSAAVLSSPQITGPTGPDADETPENGPVSRAGSWAGNGHANGEAAHKMATADTPGHSRAAVEPKVGLSGRSVAGEEAAAGESNSGRPTTDWGEC